MKKVLYSYNPKLLIFLVKPDKRRLKIVKKLELRKVSYIKMRVWKSIQIFSNKIQILSNNLINNNNIRNRQQAEKPEYLPLQYFTIYHTINKINNKTFYHFKIKFQITLYF